MALDHLERLAAVTRLAHDLDTRLVLEQRAQAGPHEVVIIRE
jgi:hypothetical protein